MVTVPAVMQGGPGGAAGALLVCVDVFKAVGLLQLDSLFLEGKGQIQSNKYSHNGTIDSGKSSV